MSAFRRTLALLSSAAGPSSASASTAPTASSLVAHLQRSSLPAFVATNTDEKRLYKKSLYEHLSQLPNDGIGTRVRPVKWVARGIDIPREERIMGPINDVQARKQSGHLCYWLVTRARIRRVGESKKPHGKVWGRLVWRGKPITPEGKDERIRGGLKHSWDAAL